MLTPEEIEVLEFSPVCLNCGHREILHSYYSDFCLVPECMCYQSIAEGSFCQWPGSEMSRTYEMVSR